MTADAHAICYVRWIDSVILNEQIYPHEVPKPVEIHSVGWVAEETEEHITLTREIMDDGDYRSCVSIPKVAVREVKTLPHPADQGRVETE